MLRTAEADVLPHVTSDFAETVERYAGELHKLADTMRENTEQQHRLLDEKLHNLAADPKRGFAAPVREADVPVLNFAPLDNALLRLKKTTRSCDESLSAAMKLGLKPDSSKLRELNTILRSLEQTLLWSEGLPNRPWFRHMIYAPGAKTGYAVKTLPGLREAIEDRRWSDTEKFAGIIAGSLDAYCDALDRSMELLQVTSPRNP